MNRLRVKKNYQTRTPDMVFWGNKSACSRLAKQKRKFQHDVEVLFASYIESGSQRNNFQWGCVKSIYNGIKNDVKCIWSLKMCCVFVFELFCTFSCDDQPLVMKVIYIYHQVLNEYKDHFLSVMGLCNNCIQLNNPRHYILEELVSASSVLSKINDTVEYTYRFTNGELYSKLTSEALSEGDYVFLKFFVTYGLSYSPHRELEEVSVQLQRLYCNYDSWKIHEGHYNEVRERYFIESVKQQFIMDVENPNIRRLNLIIKYVTICFRRRFNDNFFPDYVKCLELYVLTLPEPVVSVKEIEDFLHMAFSSDRAFITVMSSDFTEVFQDSPSLSSPRSLRHLCRCKVRECIQKRSPLPSMISGLKLPTKIEDYLLFLSH